jgi:hypothetical protein
MRVPATNYPERAASFTEAAFLQLEPNRSNALSSPTISTSPLHCPHAQSDWLATRAIILAGI